MFHLFVSASEESWKGDPWEIEEARCLKKGEYTDAALAVDFSKLTGEDEVRLLTYPCIFAHETVTGLDPRLGWITRIWKREGQLRIEYRFEDGYPSIKHDHLIELKWELSIGDLELNRTHWALKNENLSEALERLGYPALGSTTVLDVHSHIFPVALSFPGEVRTYVEATAFAVAAKIGKKSVFYDSWYKAQLARPNLDTALQALYQRARLVVAFLSEDYANKKWCHIEFRAIREILNERQDDRVMFVRHDGAEIKGVFSSDGYIDADKHAPGELAEMIFERLSLIPQ